MDRVLKQYFNKMTRVCIYPKDVQVVTGRSERWGREVIVKIKKHLSKPKHQLVTIDEFCTYLGLEKETVLTKLYN